MSGSQDIADRLKPERMARILEQAFGSSTKDGRRGEYYVTSDTLSKLRDFKATEAALRKVRAGLDHTLLTMATSIRDGASDVVITAAHSVAYGWPEPTREVIEAVLGKRFRSRIERVKYLYDTEVQRSFRLGRAEFRELAGRPKLTDGHLLTFAGELLDAGFVLFEPSRGGRGSRLFGLCRVNEIKRSWRQMELVTLEEAERWLRTFDMDTGNIEPEKGQ